MAYNSLEQRIAKKYIDVFPQFVPDENANAGIFEQEQFYNLMNNLYQLAFDEPLLFVTRLHEDDFYPSRHNKVSYGKPQLQANMVKFIKAVGSLLQNMFLAGKGEDVHFSKRQQIILSKLNIEDLTNLPPGWVWMSTRPNADLHTFSYCIFKAYHPYTSDIYARIFGETAFRRLESRMSEQGYTRIDVPVTAAGGFPSFSLTYINPVWSQEPPMGGFHFKIKHTGISATYDPTLEPSACFGLCIPNDLMKPLIESFDSMSEMVKGFIIKKTAKCWDCKFCVQTDKTGSRPMAYIPIAYKQDEYKLCPRFPGFSYYWTSIDNDLADILIEMLSFMDKFAPKDTIVKNKQLLLVK